MLKKWVKQRKVQILSEKEEASSEVVSMVPLVLTIIVVGVLGIMFASWCVNFERKNTVDGIVRKYMLRMESYGYLTSDELDLMEEELGKAYVTDISFTGTTFSEVDYGETITLCVSGKLETINYEIINLFSQVKESNGEISISIKKQSTAKQLKKDGR